MYTEEELQEMYRRSNYYNIRTSGNSRYTREFNKKINNINLL